MGLFKKKEIVEKANNSDENYPELPELPKLPELPGTEKNKSSKASYLLPSFPNNSLGEKFSRDTIKKAVTGEEEGEEVFDAYDFAEEDMQMMQKPQRRVQEIPDGFEEAERRIKKIEPVFIRLDKFEESLHLFEKTKKQILEIENMLSEIKRIKEHEEKELEHWENEMQSIKTQIEKVDKDIFSKIE